MALFFDRIWFDAHLDAIGLTRDDLAQRSGISRADLDLMYKDQIEVSADFVHAWSRIMGVDAEEIAKQCGFIGRLSVKASVGEQIAALEARVSALEALMGARTMPPNED